MPPSALPAPAQPSIAVLPFSSLSSDPAGYFADGLVEDLTTTLSDLRLTVIARASSFHYRGVPWTSATWA